MPEEAPSPEKKSSTPDQVVKDEARRWNWHACLRKIGIVAAATFGIFLLLYCWGTVFYNGPFSQGGWGNALLASTWLGAMTLVFFLIKIWKQRLLWWLAGFIMVLLPYLMIKPTNDREWEPEFGRTGYAHIQGDVVTLYNIRNFTHRDRTDFDVRWETRKYRLSNLRGLEYFQSNFYGDTLAHTILSFDFGVDGRICLSVETRREVGEKFDPFGGLYKMFELQYLFITEEDCIPLRTKVREETVRLYTIKGPIEKIREMFLASVEIQNDLAEHPRFYNVLRANCTTSLRAQRPKSDRMPWDHRLLLNGRLDEYLYEENLIETHGLDFETLREKATISTRANAAIGSPDFSQIIRQKSSD